MFDTENFYRSNLFKLDFLPKNSPCLERNYLMFDKPLITTLGFYIDKGYGYCAYIRFMRKQRRYYL